MNLRKTFLSLVIGATFSAPALAQDVELGLPNHGGSGCPQGSVGANLSPDNSQLSILFDEYIAEAGEATGKRIGRKTCNLSVPIKIPQGYSMSIYKVDYRGYAYVPRGGQAKFNVEYFFAGQRGPKTRKTFRGGTDDDYVISDTLAAHALVWSPCGAEVNLRMNTSMMARSNRYMDDVLATVDTVDIDSGMVYHVQWRRCGGWH